jgi:pimeloyl-ACP methyl ester carboxylesterase
MATFVLVHGGWHGGWCWRKVTPLLRAAGHEVHSPTLTGLGERAHLATPLTGLETHIQDVLGVLAFEELRDVVLVGHSMAGMVVTGVAERAPERLAHLVYLDASVPRDGECDLDCNGLRGAARAAFEARAGSDGLLAPRLRAHMFGIASAEDSAWVNGKLTPHPIKAFTDPLRVTDATRFAGRRTFVLCSEGKDAASAETQTAARVLAEPGWRYHELATGHDAMVTAPRELSELLLEAAGVS